MTAVHYPTPVQASEELDEQIVEYFGHLPRNVVALFAIKTLDGPIPLYPTAYPPSPEAFEVSEKSFTTAVSGARNVSLAANPLNKALESYPSFKEFAVALMSWKRKGLQKYLPIVPIVPKGKSGRASGDIDEQIERMKKVEEDDTFAQMVARSLNRAANGDNDTNDDETAPGAE